MTKQILDYSFWTKKRQLVNNSYDFNKQWDEIIERFKHRIEDCYFKPIDRVKDPNDLKGEGFTILTIQCALIEMFAAFKYGLIHKFDKDMNDPNYTYNKAYDCYIKFLHEEPIVENHFYKFDNEIRIDDKPFSAKDFYNKVRCGLMHEARTKREWLVNAKTTYEGNETVFITKNTVTNKISIDRTILNKQLKQYFNTYLQNLKQKSAEGKQLRRLFARKLDHLYDIPADNDYDWWNNN